MTWNCLRQNGDMLYAVNVYICLMSHMPEQMVMRLQDGANIAGHGVYIFKIRLPQIIAYACRGGTSEQTTNQWRQLYVLTSQITGVTNMSLD